MPAIDDGDDTLRLLLALAAIDSVNPDLVPGAAGEAEVARYVADWATGAGLEVHVDDVEPGRPNVVAVARGRGEGRSLMLNAHLDVVGVDGYPDAFRPVAEAGRICGRGVLDTKAGLAAALVAARRAHRCGLGDVIVTAVVDEECASKGTESLLGSWRADAAVVLEPTELAMVTDHRGFVWGRLVVHGRAAHGSRPDLGVDAIAHAGPLLVGVDALQRRLAGRAPHPVLGHASVHASLIAGGHELSTYPHRCVIDIERRTLPGEDANVFEVELGELAALADKAVQVEVSTWFERSPLHVPADSPIAVALAAAGQANGLSLGSTASSFWTDAALLDEAGIPAVVFGPGGGGIHETFEWLDLGSFAAFETVLWQTITEFCGT